MVMRKHRAVLLAGAAISANNCICQAELNQSDFTNNKVKPNILLILADDMGKECLGIYGSSYYTPNIDALAKDAILFQNAFSQPLSTPSRVELMTGKYNHRNYVDFGFLNQDQKTFANVAKECGYKTCIAGKWQLGENSNLPGHFGFDKYCLWQLNYPRTNATERYRNPLIEQDGVVLKRDNEIYGPDVFVNYIKDFIACKNEDSPFFVYYSMVLVHDPFKPTPDSQEWECGNKSDIANFPNMVSYCDKNVGILIDFLKQQGLYENTVIIFIGDNGTDRRVNTTMKDGRVMKGGKGLPTDAGTRVPMIVRHPSSSNSGKESDVLIDFSDFYPTLAEIMGYGKEIDSDGVSFLPELLDVEWNSRKWVFCHYDSFFHGSDKPDENACRFIRNHKYKLYSTGEFYNIEDDPLELNNILLGKGDDEAEKAREFLSAELRIFPEWHKGDITTEKVVLPGLEPNPRYL